jgi:hypothetical protein
MLETKIGFLSLVLIAGLGLALFADDTPKPAAAAAAEPGTLLLVDSAGKEQKLKTWKFTTGTQRLSWLAPAEEPEEKPIKEKSAKDKAAGKEKPAKRSTGPEALVVRDELKIHFLAGVTTLVPLDRIRSISFDSEKETMTVRVGTSDKTDVDVTLTGTTAYKGINKLALEADVDKGEAGIASLTYQGGVPRGNIKEVRFPTPKVQAEKGTRPAVVITTDKSVKKTHKVTDLMPLYRLAAGREKRLSTLMFKKTLKIDVAKVKKIVAGSEDSDDLVWQVVQKDGDDANLTLLDSMPVGGSTAKLLVRHQRRAEGRGEGQGKEVRRVIGHFLPSPLWGP